MGDHLRGGDRARLERLLEGSPLRLAVEEAGGEQVAGAGRVDDPAAETGDRHRDSAAPLDGERAFRPAGDDEQRDLVPDGGDGGVAVGEAGELADLVVV